MSPDGINYQHDPTALPFVTQQQSWPHPGAFANHHPLHQHQPVATYAPHQATLQHQPNDSSRASVSSVEYAWSGYRPGSSGQPMHVMHGHNPFCQQQGKPDGDLAITGHAGACPQHPNNTVAPQSITPPLSDGSPNPSWASMVSPTEPDPHHVSKRLKHDWTGFDNNAPILRPDGVRKKNAKFDIPDERNLDTLDTLIKHAKSDIEVKELKMQKRLLRNREAALHSRQKKKTHTEWLEREREALVVRQQHTQNQLTSIGIRVDELEREKTSWQDQLAQSDHKVATLQREKTMMHEQHARDMQKLHAELEHMREQLQGGQQNVPTGSDPTSNPSFSPDHHVGFGNDSSFDNGEWQSGYEFIDANGPDILVH